MAKYSKQPKLESKQRPINNRTHNKLWYIHKREQCNNKQTIATCNNKYDLSKHNIERKKSDSKQSILYDFLYI